MTIRKKVVFILINLVFWSILVALTYYRIDSLAIWTLLLGLWFYADSQFRFSLWFWIIYIACMSGSIILVAHLADYIEVI